MAHDVFLDPAPHILPSILAADFARLADDVRHAATLVKTPVIHIDIMDGHLVPNLSLGVPVVQSLRRALPDLFFDIHLMIDEPVRYAESFVKAGGQNLTIHIEAPEVKPDPLAAVRAIQALGSRVGITLKPHTPIEAILEVLPEVDLVLIMSVEPGFGGQSFMADQLQKARRIKPLLRSNQRLEIDGGIAPDTIAQARQAGVEWFVVGSALFGAKDREAAGNEMRAIIEG